MKLGILSYEGAKKVESVSFAMTEIQDRRTRVVVPNGLPLHSYVNLYIHSRNVTLYVRRNEHNKLGVLQVTTDVLDLPEVVIADGNASSDYTAFYPSPEGLRYLNKELVFSEYWTSSDPIDRWRRRRVRCAEVLVPEKIDPNYIVGIYVSNNVTKNLLLEMGVDLPVNVSPHLFFQ